MKVSGLEISGQKVKWKFLALEHVKMMTHLNLPALSSSATDRCQFRSRYEPCQVKRLGNFN